MGYKDWFVDSDIVVPGSAKQRFWRTALLCLHKEGFAAILQIKVESHTKNIDPLLLSKQTELRKSPSPALVEEVMKQDTFKDKSNTFYQKRVLNLK